ncbi:hypothetical protein BDZ97DRAFT_1632578, partial [Flammula alnicola]
PPSPAPPPVVAEPLSRADRRKKRNKQQSKQHKKKQKLTSEPRPFDKLTGKHAQGTSQIPSSFDAAGSSIATTGYVGQRRDDPPKTFELSELVGPHSRYGFELRAWNGKHRVVFVDSSSRVIGVGVSLPANDATWADVHREAAEALEEARGRLDLKKGDNIHRRGCFPA